jgi:hypothetical protein
MSQASWQKERERERERESPAARQEDVDVGRKKEGHRHEVRTSYEASARVKGRREDRCLLDVVLELSRAKDEAGAMAGQGRRKKGRNAQNECTLGRSGAFVV